jgi:hypothetical protein
MHDMGNASRGWNIPTNPNSHSVMHTQRAAPRLDRRTRTLILLLFAPLALLFAAVGALPQSLEYHALADWRIFVGVPNFMNVASNVGFLIVGALGVRLCLGNDVPGAARSWLVFFVGVLLAAFGSAYYHLAPSNATLVWDRLPMAVAFMGLFSALMAEHVAPRMERKILPLAVAVGVFSVAWWHYADDLRLYAWVQFGPLVALVYVLSAYAPLYPHRRYLGAGLVFYALSKIMEYGDGAIFDATARTVSGHSLKHLIAALATFCVYVMLRKRRIGTPA